MLMEMGFRGVIATSPAIMITLLIFSVLLTAFVFERGLCFLLHGGWSDAFWKRLKACVQAGRMHEARSMCEKNRNIFAQVFHTAIGNAHLSRVDNEDLTQIAKENEQERLRKRLGLFATLSFISPLVGLLGTVTGIMQAFTDLGRAGSGGANIVAAGISEALITTAAGIVVAVPAAMFYNYFTFRLRSIVVRMNNYANELIILMYGGEEVGDHPAQPKASKTYAKATQ